MHYKTNYNIKLLVTMFLFFTVSISFAQSTEQKDMKKLSFLIGDWKGKGSAYPKNKSKPYDVLSKVRYDLDGEILVLKHRSFRGDTSVLSLHTIMYYNKKDTHYYYNSYTKSGTRPFRCQLSSKQFICKRGEDYKLVFQLTENGAFNEYGERLINGKWIKSFEDILLPTSEITF